MAKIFIILLPILLLSSCGFNKNNEADSMIKQESNNFAVEKPLQAKYRKISAEEALNIMESGEAFILLDVRTDEEYEAERIAGSVLLPDYELGSRAEAELTDKNALILVYCRTGRRSANAANELVDMGYTRVYDFGGIIDWPYGSIE